MDKDNISIIKKEGMVALINKWIDDYNVFMPVLKDGDVRFRKAETHIDNVILAKARNQSVVILGENYLNTTISPKHFFFPQSECLFKYDLSALELQSPDVDDRVNIIIGMRPCDARAISILDKLFLSGDYVDNLYKERREKTKIISLGCNDPEPTCFCTAIGGDPFGDTACDVLLADLGDVFAIDVKSDWGKGIFAEIATPTTEQDIEKLRMIKSNANKQLPSDKDIPTAEMSQNLSSQFESKLWDEIWRKCIGCGICAYLCPTCHCFDMSDEMRNDVGCRLRTWDSCMFPLFTLHASGHNPRTSGKERMRQRIMHKFRYYVDMFGEIACVGCGRCVRKCPMNIDVREIIKIFES